MHNEYDVIIVGGGAAGIGAARRLTANGKAVLLLEASARLGGRAFTQDLAGYPLDLGCEWLHSGDRNAWVSIAEASGFPVDRSDPPWGKAHPGIAWDEDEEEAARKAFGEWEERLRAVAQGSDQASDALEPGGEWNAYVRAIAGFMSGVAPERISATDYMAYDDASTGRNWNLPLGYGTLVAASLPPAAALRLATPVERIDLTADGVAVSTRAGTVRARAAILTVSTGVLAGDAIRLPAGVDPWREAAASLPLGRNEKVFLEIGRDAAFEPAAHAYGNLRDPRSASYSIRPNGWPIIEAFLGGDGARILEEEGPAAGSRTCRLSWSPCSAATCRRPSGRWRRRRGAGCRPSAARIAAPCRADPMRGHVWPGLSRTASSSPARRRTLSTPQRRTAPTTAGKGPPTRPWRRLRIGTGSDGGTSSPQPEHEASDCDLSHGGAARRPARLGSIPTHAISIWVTRRRFEQTGRAPRTRPTEHVVSAHVRAC
jgi:monoamine oxidase